MKAPRLLTRLAEEVEDLREERDELKTQIRQLELECKERQDWLESERQLVAYLRGKIAGLEATKNPTPEQAGVGSEKQALEGHG
jgi:uncharacterized coiled-coil DUF342 family protein